MRFDWQEQRSVKPCAPRLWVRVPPFRQTQYEAAVVLFNVRAQAKHHQAEHAAARAETASWASSERLAAGKLAIASTLNLGEWC